jgi:hypothetical protein
MRFRRRRRPSSTSTAPTNQQKRRVRRQHIRALEHVLGGSVGRGFDTLCHQLSQMRHRDDAR